MQKLKILVADDDPITLSVVGALLSRWGYEVISVADGEQARCLLRAGGIRICVLDWEMPGLNGRDLCAWIHSVALDPVPYVIMLTAKGNPLQICDGFAVGADDYITKPFERDDLRFRLAELALRVMRFDALGEEIRRQDPMERYRLDLEQFHRRKTIPTT
jgi:DNA-binding response OmpR family regulator